MQQEFLVKLGVQKLEFLGSTINLSFTSKTTGLCPIFTLILAVPEASGNKGEIYTSNVVQIKVSDPPSYEKDAVEYLKKLDMGILLNAVTSRTTVFTNMEDILEKATIFIEVYSNSIYTPFVVESLNLNLDKIRIENEGILPGKFQSIYERVQNISKAYNIKPVGY